MITRLTFITIMLTTLGAHAQDDFNTKPWENKKYPIIIDPYHGNKIDFDKLITDKNVMGIIHKASQGLTIDSEYKNRSNKSKEKNLLFASYHLGTNSDPIEQADFYLNTIKDNLNQPMALDIEDYELDPKHPNNPYMKLVNAEKFINRIYERTKKYPIVYINNKVFSQINAKYNKKSVFSRCELWYARFKKTLPKLSSKVWDKVLLWQFSSELNCSETGSCWYNIPGTEYDIDINVFNGDSNELKLFWNSNQPVARIVNEPTQVNTAQQIPTTEGQTIEVNTEQSTQNTNNQSVIENPVRPVRTNTGQQTPTNGVSLMQQGNGQSIQGANGKASSSTLEAVYDFEKQTYLNDQLKPKHKQPVIFKIININKIANKTEIVNSDIKIIDDFLDGEVQQAKSIIAENKTTEPIIREPLNTHIDTPKDLEKTSKKNTEKVNSKIDEIKKEIDKKKLTLLNKKNELEQNKNDISTLDRDIASIQNNISQENQSKNPDTTKIKQLNQSVIDKKKAIDDLNKSNLTLNGEVKKLSSEIDDQYAELTIYNDNLKNFKDRISKLSDAYDDIQLGLININRINAAYDSYIAYIINPRLTKLQYSNESSNICVILNPIKKNSYYESIRSFELLYSQFNAQFNQLFNNDLFYSILNLDSSYANLVKLKFENVKKEIETIYKLVNTSDLRKKLNNVDILNNALSHDSSFTVVSNPIQSFQDYIEFKVKIAQDNTLGSFIIKENPKEFTYTEYVRQGVRWDFSVGTVFDFGIKNQEYEIKSITTELIPATATTPEIPSTSKYQIVENNSSVFTPTIAGLLHTSFRSNSMFAFGLSLGTSIDLATLNLNSFFPGVSLLIGKQNKKIITIGPSFKRVKQLKSIYQTNTDYTEQLQVDNVTSYQYKIGWFFGLSWNLTNKQRAKIIK